MTTITRTRARRWRWLAALVAVMLAGSISAAVPTSAQAATSCGGAYVRTVSYTNPHNGQVVGKLGIYRSGTKVCAVVLKAGPLYGVSSYVGLYMYTLKPSGAVGAKASDSGYFKYQTDALTIDTALGDRCAHISFEMYSKYGNWLQGPRNVNYCV